MLTTTEAAGVAAVAPSTPSTMKRWADQGLLPFSRTAGGHRRFERFAVERLLREQAGSVSGDNPAGPRFGSAAARPVRPSPAGRSSPTGPPRQLSASALLGDEQALRAITDEVGAACKERVVGLLLGGQGSWPAQPSYGVRLTSFAAFRDYLTEEMEQP